VQQQLERMRMSLSRIWLQRPQYRKVSRTHQENHRSELEKDMRPEAERRVGLARFSPKFASAEALSVSADELRRRDYRLKQDYPSQAPKKSSTTLAPRRVYNHLMASKVIAALTGYAEGK